MRHLVGGLERRGNRDTTVPRHRRIRQVLTIRNEQVEAFRLAALRAFEDDMVRDLKGFAPAIYETRGEPILRQLIRVGIGRAKGYGFTNRGPVRLYIELMVLFGCDF